MSASEVIAFETGKRSGQACIRGLRITAADVLQYLASGMSEAKIPKEFPYFISSYIEVYLVFVADHDRQAAAPSSS